MKSSFPEKKKELDKKKYIIEETQYTGGWHVLFFLIKDN